MISSKSDLPRFLTTVVEISVEYDKNTHQWAAGVVRVGEAIALTGIMWAIAPGNNALAQIKPDGTLGSEGSAVTEDVMINGGLADRINGGATRGTNLFHSFEQFNIGNGQRVYFANPVGIENIFSRVTSSDPSDILGTLGVEGGANLFFLNPNGIIFGENAALDVKGSFVATTANAIQFGNQGFFSAATPEVSPLLTVNPSAFFFNQIIPERIENRSITPAGVNLLGESLKGLRVPDGQSLLLVGGDIAIAGGGLNALGGRVELVGLAAPGTVALNRDGNHFHLSVPEGVARGDISLTNQGVVSTSGEGGGEIQVWGRRVTLTEGSQIVATTLGSEAGGGLTVDATESVELIGTGFENFEQTIVEGALSGELSPSNPGTGLFTGTVGAGIAGAIVINTKQLRLQDGAVLLSPAFSQGAGGSLSVRASEFVEVISSGLATSTLRSATGAAGSITIDTRWLIIREGAVVATATLGEGAGGEIILRASESVEILRIGPALNSSLPSGLFASTQGIGEAGDVTIITGTLLVQDGARINADTSGQGNGGNLTINAFDSVQLRGIDSGLFVNAISGSTAGNLTVATRQMSVSDGAQVTVSSPGGQAGNLTIQTNSLLLNQGRLFAESGKSSTEGGANIKLSGLDLLRMDNESLISANALDQANGGNITIDSTFIVALPNENSDITANAFSGQGGRVTITAQGLYNFTIRTREEIQALLGSDDLSQFDTSQLPTNDITAISQTSPQLSQIPTINLQAIDPAQGLVELPTDIVDVARLVEQNLCQASQGSAFTITGRGGLPTPPNEALNADTPWEDWRIDSESEPMRQSYRVRSDNQRTTDNKPKAIIEAQGWHTDAFGNVVLTAEPTTITPHEALLSSANCQ